MQILLIAVFLFPVAGVSGLLEGKRCGRKGIPVGRACLRGFRRAFFTTTLTALVIINLATLAMFLGPGTVADYFEVFGTSLIISPIVGLLASLLPAPMAAFLAYNFGARKRAEEELARQSQPPVPDDP